jgi:hypothetical protein
MPSDPTRLSQGAVYHTPHSSSRRRVPAPGAGSRSACARTRIFGGAGRPPRPALRKCAARRPVPYASYPDRIESHLRPIQEFVFNNTEPDWGPRPKERSPTTSPTATAATTTAGSPPSNANTESPHEFITGQTFGSDPLDPMEVGRAG